MNALAAISRASRAGDIPGWEAAVLGSADRLSAIEICDILGHHPHPGSAREASESEAQTRLLEAGCSWMGALATGNGESSEAPVVALLGERLAGGAPQVSMPGFALPAKARKREADSAPAHDWAPGAAEAESPWHASEDDQASLEDEAPAIG